MKKEIISFALVEEYIDEDTANKRIGKCLECKFRVGEDCSLCGCFYEIKAEMKFNKNPKKFFRIEETHCPIGLWNDVEIANKYRKIDGKPLLE